MTKSIITVSREFGSGGRTIAHKVAERLGVPYYDKELIKAVAEGARRIRPRPDDFFHAACI